MEASRPAKSDAGLPVAGWEEKFSIKSSQDARSYLSQSSWPPPPLLPHFLKPGPGVSPVPRLDFWRSHKVETHPSRDPRMIRRFLNLVAEDYKTGAYSLHRLDISKHLFHQSRVDARVVPTLLLAGAEDKQGQGGSDEQPMLDKLEELPSPCVKVHPCYREERVVYKLPFWGFLSPRRSEDKFLCMNWMGDTMLCDAGKASVDPMPHLGDEVGLHSVSFSVVRPDHAQDQEEDDDDLDLDLDLCVIHDAPERRRGANTSCFRVLRRKDAADGWRWESLPRPPFVGSPRYDPALFMDSYTLVDGGRTICLSNGPGIGTYCFNTVDREWRHAGDWVLPFEGGAEYVPDLDLWLGFSPCGAGSQRCHYLCGTSDLNAMSMDKPPKLQYVWQDLVTPENWSAGWTQVVSLGSGRFCIAKAFVVENRRTGKSGDEWLELENEVLVLTGIEVGKDDDDERLLKVWKHKSMQYGSMFSVKGVL